MSDVISGHTLCLLCSSKDYFSALAQAMASAQQEVRLETYIFDFTASGQDVANSLIRAAERGVKVYLLMDGAGTLAVPAQWQSRFDAAGVQWHIYNPMDRFGLLRPSRWRRLHRKLCVVDGGTSQALGFCGGINILDDFHDPNHGALTDPRLDFAVQANGPLLSEMHDAMQKLWLRQMAYAQISRRKLQAAAHTWITSRALSRRPLAVASSNDIAATTHNANAALLLRDNLRNRKRIEAAYLKAIGEAQQEIIIANAYFLPGRRLRQALLRAARRGVKVKLLLQGRYEYFMQYHAARPVYDALLSAGVEIHEYAASFLHAKVAVIDAFSAQAWATVGSSNLDPLSLLLAREANVVVRDGVFARELHERLIHAMTTGGQSVSQQKLASRPMLQRALDRIAFGLMRLALAITGRRY